MKLSICLVLGLICAGVRSSPLGEGARLIKTSEDQEAKWLTDAQIWDLIEAHVGFMDVTDHNLPQIKPDDVNVDAIPTALRYQTTVRSIIPTSDSVRVEAFIRQMASYPNRYYQHQNGVDSQRWLLTQVRNAVVGYPTAVEITEVTHSFMQKSIIAKIQGSNPSLRSEIVIIGAHQDSINTAGASLNAPGADDNASGSAVVLETLRTLVSARFVPKRTLEFHWYAGEERGLLGSADIARSYYSDGKTIVSMVNFDVPGYHVAGNDNVGIYTDRTDATLNALLRLIVDAYLNYGWVNRTCGYGCSDHASWTTYGYPASMPAEQRLHPQMHSIGDNMANVGMTQVMEFVKLSVAYMIEVGEPNV